MSKQENGHSHEPLKRHDIGPTVKYASMSEKDKKKARAALAGDKTQAQYMQVEEVYGLKDLIGSAFRKKGVIRNRGIISTIKAKGFPSRAKYAPNEQAPAGTLGVYKTRIK